MSGAFVVWEMGKGKWVVLSLNSKSGRPKQYCVTANGYRFLCNCPRFLKNSDDVNFVCKHIIAVLKAIGKEVEVVKEYKDIKERIEELEKRIEDLEACVDYAINPANYY